MAEYSKSTNRSIAWGMGNWLKHRLVATTNTRGLLSHGFERM
jgi:hypothetical protein